MFAISCACLAAPPRSFGYINVGALEAWYALAEATVTALFGAALLYATMNKSRRHTFYAPKTIRQYVDEWHWETRTVARIGTGQDAARAHTCTSFAARYLPAAKVKAWLAAHWTAWEEDPPVWYTAAWRRKVGKNLREEWPRAASGRSSAQRGPREIERAETREGRAESIARRS
mmetsp:Transcript_19255/g.40215  ORF Transcript_19255/g.40215 Transcript_19255/m.40215 type:complete len:174 (-) Transcript_19255:84-605(-)